MMFWSKKPIKDFVDRPSAGDNEVAQPRRQKSASHNVHTNAHRACQPRGAGGLLPWALNKLV